MSAQERDALAEVLAKHRASGEDDMTIGLIGCICGQSLKADFVAAGSFWGGLVQAIETHLADVILGEFTVTRKRQPDEGPVACECNPPRPELEFPVQHSTKCPRFTAGRGGVPTETPDERLKQVEAILSETPHQCDSLLQAQHRLNRLRIALWPGNWSDWPRGEQGLSSFEVADLNSALADANTRLAAVRDAIEDDGNDPERPTHPERIAGWRACAESVRAVLDTPTPDKEN